MVGGGGVCPVPAADALTRWCNKCSRSHKWARHDANKEGENTNVFRAGIILPHKDKEGLFLESGILKGIVKENV